MNKGKLVVVDGTDATGKATQVELLFRRCEKEGVKAKKIDFPRYTSNILGALIRECLDGKHGDFLAIDPKIVSVLYAGDRYESSAEIRSWLEEGYVVIADRYVSANQIHQGGKIKDDEERVHFLKWLDSLEHVAFNLPRPDCILYLHLPLEISLRLIRERAATEKKDLDQAESNAKHLLESQQSALSIVKRTNTWHKVECATNDGTGIKTREEIHEMLWKVFREVTSFS